MLCSADGYCYAFVAYCGKAAATQEGPLGTRVVLSMLSSLEIPFHHAVFFDNFFTSHKLLIILSKKGIHHTGNISEMRPKKVRYRVERSCKRNPGDTMTTGLTPTTRFCW